MNIEQLLSCALDIGEQMLLSGAEVGRVETTVKLICTAYRCRRADVFTITSSIVVSIISEEGIHLTQTRRIQGATTDLTRLDRLNNLSREICRTTPNYTCVHKKLCQICAGKTYPLRRMSPKWWPMPRKSYEHWVINPTICTAKSICPVLSRT